MVSQAGYCSWNTAQANGAQECASLIPNPNESDLKHAENDDLEKVPIAHNSSDNNALDAEDSKLEEVEDMSHYALQGYQYIIVQSNEGRRKKTLFKCAYEGWNKIFGKTWNFLDHARMHEGLRPFVWDICSKSFTQKGNMLKHKRQHVIPDVKDRKSHNCPFCTKKYTEKYNLKVWRLWETLLLQINVNFIVNMYFEFPSCGVPS